MGQSESSKSKSGLSNINQRSALKQPNRPDRATVIHDLGKLRQELRAAMSMDSPNREDIVRRRIDRKLEELWSCVDPAGVASESEWGGLST